jgi:hypothetical protein
MIGPRTFVAAAPSVSVTASRAAFAPLPTAATGLDCCLRAPFDAPPDRLAALPDRLAALPDRLAALPDRLAALPDRLAALPGRLAALRDRLAVLRLAPF